MATRHWTLFKKKRPILCFMVFMPPSIMFMLYHCISWVSYKDIWSIYPNTSESVFMLTSQSWAQRRDSHCYHLKVQEHWPNLLIILSNCALSDKLPRLTKYDHVAGLIFVLELLFELSASGYNTSWDMEITSPRSNVFYIWNTLYMYGHQYKPGLFQISINRPNKSLRNTVLIFFTYYLTSIEVFLKSCERYRTIILSWRLYCTIMINLVKDLRF